MALKLKKKRLQRKRRKERTWKEEHETSGRPRAKLIGEDSHTGKPDCKPGVTSMVLTKCADGNFKLRGSLHGAKYAHCLMRMADGANDWHHAVTRYAQHPERWRECIPLGVAHIIDLILQGPAKYDEYKLVAASGASGELSREKSRSAATPESLAAAKARVLKFVEEQGGCKRRDVLDALKLEHRRTVLKKVIRAMVQAKELARTDDFVLVLPGMRRKAPERQWRAEEEKKPARTPRTLKSKKKKRRRQR